MEKASIYEDTQGRLWVGIATGGLHLFDCETGEDDEMTFVVLRVRDTAESAVMA